MCAAFALLAGASPAAATDLRGQVMTVDGGAIPRASVFIYTAAPRTGTSTLCPSCYPDCGKKRNAGRNGKFMIRALSDSLIFRVLVTAKGYEPAFVDSVDPKAGAIAARLRARERNRTIAFALRGRVVDPLGRAVVGASVSPTGLRLGERRRFGLPQGTDPLSVTDENGEYFIATRDTGAVWYVKVRARDLAPRAFSEVPARSDSVKLELAYGATVTGRVLREGKPHIGVTIGLSSANQAAGGLFSHEEIATDGRGRFTFVNVPPHQAFVVYGTMHSLGPTGSLAVHPFTTGDDGTINEVPSLEVGPAHRLSGRVTLSDGRPLPAGTRLLVTRTQAWDQTEVTLNEDGQFQVQGVPQEIVATRASLEAGILRRQEHNVHRAERWSLQLHRSWGAPRVPLLAAHPRLQH